MAVFGLIKCDGVIKDDTRKDGKFEFYINTDHIQSFTGNDTASVIRMMDGTVYLFKKPLEDLMDEYGRIEYEM